MHFILVYVETNEQHWFSSVLGVRALPAFISGHKTSFYPI